VRDNLYDTMKSILAWHLNGTRYGIHCDTDGLLSAGGPDTQLTWMDAKIGDFVATPRYGKPVEIQALWYNALRFTEALARRFEDPEEEKLLAGIAPRTLESFNAAFWNEEAGCLFDVVNEDGKDASIRPNQVIALSLGYGMVPEERARQILYVVERELLTPYGLRTLSPSDPHYCGHCDGGPFDRDSSYHQGTVWPWLLGPYVTACAKIRGEVRNSDYWMIPLQQYLNEAGVGTLPEIFDGDAPHRARGCIAQAWSVAEILRVISEDLLAKPGSAA
jgi:predicted glycogen debranching enzyme